MDWQRKSWGGESTILQKGIQKGNHGIHWSPWYGVPGYTTHKRTDFTRGYGRRECNVPVRMYHLLFVTFRGTLR